VCTIKGCSNKHLARGWCAKHYSRWQRFGDPNYTVIAASDLTLEDKLRWHGWTVTESGCWEFDGGKSKGGYGALTLNNHNIKAHRVAYELWVGPIPEGLVVRHFVCDNPPCINPDHLRVGTTKDNSQDMVRAGRGYKVKGSLRSNSKLTELEALAIKNNTTNTQKQLAKLYGISASVVCSIRTGTSWRHLPDRA